MEKIKFEENFDSFKWNNVLHQLKLIFIIYMRFYSFINEKYFLGIGIKKKEELTEILVNACIKELIVAWYINNI